MSQSQMLYSGRVCGIKFSLSGTETVERDAYTEIKTWDLFRNNVPYEGGVYDAHMGTTDHAYRCKTCYNSKEQCIGHEGMLRLNYPVWNPMAANETRKWIKLICFKCGKPVIDDASFKNLRAHVRLAEASKLARTTNRACVHCDEVHPLIKRNNNEVLSLEAEFYEDKVKKSSYTLFPHKIAEIFSRITDETVIALGKHPSSHPRNFILHAIKVPSVSIRPDVKKMGGGRSANDDLTTLLQVMVRKRDYLPAVIPQVIDDKMASVIWEINNSYYDFVKASGENSVNSLANRLKGKQGRFRKNQMGKRVRNMCRSTITGDPRLRLEEVGVPLTFARTIQYKETVQSYNKQRLLECVMNGRKKYPGATKIIKRSTGTEYDVDALRDYELESGDVVLRDMVDGDPVNFNRQPSLMLSNISTHRARVINDPSVKTLLMNVLVTPLKL